MLTPNNSPNSIRRLRQAVGLCLLLASGCGYNVGPMYPAEIRTIHVPIFTSSSFRRNVELQLTEAVQKEVQLRTPYRLAKREYADTILNGRVIEIRKEVLGESAQDDPRELQFSVAVEVEWKDNRTGELLATQKFPISPDAIHLIAEADFAPELGQSYATASDQAVKQLARQIVDMMELTW